MNLSAFSHNWSNPKHFKEDEWRIGWTGWRRKNQKSELIVFLCLSFLLWKENAGSLNKHTFSLDKEWLESYKNNTMMILEQWPQKTHNKWNRDS